MSIGFSSAARNLFLLGSTGAQVVTNFFKTIDQSAGTDGVYLPDEIKYNFVDQKFVLAGSASDTNSKGFGWFEKRDQAGSAEWDVRVEALSAGVNTTLRAMELDSNDNLIVVGKTGNVPWIAKYSNGGVIDWQSTTNSADVEYYDVTSDSNGQYYACGNTPTSGQAQAFVEKFDANGNPGWGKSAFMLGRDVVLKKIDANSKGEVVAVGYLEDDSSDKGYIVKIDTNTGEVLWDKTLYSVENGRKDCICNSVFIDSKDQIYIVGEKRNADNTFMGFIIKYTAEGNMIWQKEMKGGSVFTPDIPGYQFVDVKADGETEQVIAVAQSGSSLGGSSFSLYKFSKDGSLVFSRRITSGFLTENRNVSLDADPSFYYLLFTDQITSGFNGTPDRYIFGKVSSSGNGLGDFQYDAGQSITIDYEYVNTDAGSARLSIIDGRISDGSVRNDTSDLITYPFNANKLLFDDLATQVSNKKRQMDSADSFEYSGSPAIRPTDFQELNLLGDVYSGSGNWLDQSGKGNDGVVNGPIHISSGYWVFDGVDDYIDIPLTDPSTANLVKWHDNDYSLEIWFNGDAFNVGTNINTSLIGNSHIESNAEWWSFGPEDSNKLEFYYFNGSQVRLTAATTLSTGTWYHAVFTHSSGTIKIYLNGSEDASGTVIGTPGSSRLTPFQLTIGANTGGGRWDGKVGEARIYPRALTPAQVFQNYNATKSKYINEAPDTAPKIGPGIVYDSNLLLNYDFGNRATYDRVENLATYSEDFNNTAWKSNSDYSVEVDSSVAIAPDGSTTADYIYKTNPTNPFTGLIRQFDGLTSNTTYTFSFYHKAKERDIGGLFALEPGGFTLVQSLTKTTLDVGGGWKRTYGSLNIGGRTAIRFKIELATGSTWTGTQGYYLWGAQVERGSTPGRYIKTSGSAITAPTTVKNLSSSSYTGTISGPVFDSAGYFQFGQSTTSAITNSAFNYDDTTNPDFTVEAWVWGDNWSSNGDSYSSIMNRSDGNHLFSVFIASSTGDLGAEGEMASWRFDTGGVNTQYASSGSGNNALILSTGVWNHCLWVWKDGTGYTYYLNNSSNSDHVTFATGRKDSTSAYTIGRWFNNGYELDGRIGEIRFYNRALTATEVSQNFNATRAKYGV